MLVLAASEDKTYRGASIASPTHAVDLGHADARGGTPLLRPVPPRLAARPLPRGHRAEGGGRRRGGRPAARLPLASPEGGRLLVAEHVRRRPREVDDRAARPGVAADRARVVAGPHERVGLGARRAGRRLPRQQRGPAAQQPGALGEPGRLLAQHDRDRDRRPDLRRRHRAQERRGGQGRRLRGARRRLAAARRELDRHHERPVLAQAVLPARDQGRHAGQRHDLQPGRQLRPAGRPARDRGQLVPRPRPLRRQEAGTTRPCSTR